uniref:Zinc finger, CCHC-type n=1 Tax=Tanacetum cinerariifolium TaxID=118510 RepID=A0A6L2MI86_TANCI|nr:zinc finger, CCHC-type [Tanacetum cinerariifolium]
MQVILEANDLWEVVEPQTITQINNKADKTAIAFIFQALPKDQILQVAKHKYVRTVWDALKTRHVGENRVQQAKQQTLKAEFEAFQMKENKSVDSFISKISSITSRATNEHFKEIDEKITGIIQFRDGSYAEIKGKGSILLECKNKEQRAISQDQAFGVFKEFKTRAKKEHGTKIKTFRTDRGGEFTSNEFHKYYRENEIIIQLTAPYSPQQNGVVERKNKTILSTTRSYDPDPAKTKTIPRGIPSLTALHLPTQMAHRHGVDKKSKEAEEGEGLFDTQKRYVEEIEYTGNFRKLIRDIIIHYVKNAPRLMEMVKKQAGQAVEMAYVKSKKPTKQERKNVRNAKIEKKLRYEMIYVFGEEPDPPPIEHPRRGSSMDLMVERLDDFECCFQALTVTSLQISVKMRRKGSADVDNMFPAKPPVVCEFNWQMDEFVNVTDECIAWEKLTGDHKDEFKEFFKEKVYFGVDVEIQQRELHTKE